jgi:Tfp pilus assembly protein PilX
MQPTFTSLRAFDFAQSHAYLWVYKRSITVNRFTAHYVQTDDALNALLFRLAQAEIARITEFANYTYLAETNENSCLASSIAGSDFEHLKARVDRPEPDCRVRSIKDLKNADGYVVKFVHNNQIVYAVKRSTSNWKTSYLKTHINMVFRNGELSAAEDNGFAIERTFDFYAHEAALFIASKRAFESAMKHCASYAQAFVNLSNTTAFSNLFTTTHPFINYVNTSIHQLRRHKFYPASANGTN